ncbi:TPA: UvrD-helicase domain-containing protein [Vibrio alginolyticus]
MKLSEQQEAIVNAPLVSLSVIACAGSGKTRTAIHRLAKIRNDIRNDRGYIALLSFSNVAVRTFKDDYDKYMLEEKSSGSVMKDRVVIETLDSFLTTNILRPHASRTMKCGSTPYLISGDESFLQNANFKFLANRDDGGSYPISPSEINNIRIKLTPKKLEFFLRSNNITHSISNGEVITKRLGGLGAYTHEMGKLWACKVLNEQKNVLQVLAKRYPHIIVDEAQDLDPLHGFLIKKLMKAGVKVSLIGDPNQAIYEFNGANGQFLTQFDEFDSEQRLPLNKNYRSIKDILDISNKLSGNKELHDRPKNDPRFGAYYAVYEPKKTIEVINRFTDKIKSCGIDVKNSSVLFRSRARSDKFKGTSTHLGQGKVKLLIEATICRDVHGNYYEAYNKLAACIIGLLLEAPENISSLASSHSIPYELKALRRKLWGFVRSPTKGLPPSSLKAKSEWHPLVKQRVFALLEDIERVNGFKAAGNLGNKLSAAKLSDTTIDSSINSEGVKNIRIDTVHQAKGESLSAVMYLATVREHIDDMMAGTHTETGRIGYVALTRAKDLFILGIPQSFADEFIPLLKDKGFEEWSLENE